MVKGADKETLRKMAQVAVEELREKTRGGFMNACKNVIRPMLGKPRVLPDEINWPKGFLALGLAEYAGIGLGGGVSLCDCDERGRIVSVLEEFFDHWISKGMRLQNIDDAIAGCVLLRLAVETKRQDYFAASDAMYDFLRSAHVDSEGALCYFVGQGNDYVLVDGIGQSSMFLYDYAKARCNESAYSMGLKQLELFVAHAMDEVSGLPYHGYIINQSNLAGKEVKQGIIGWGRGVGWLLLGMSRYRELRKATATVATAAKALQTENGLWAWQLCATGGPRDTSGTAMIAYGLAMEGFEQKSLVDKAIQGLLECVASDGRLMNCLDDGRGISQHPQNYGHYPWGQGIALALMSLHARIYNELQVA